jgi:hypothetical protein
MIIHAYSAILTFIIVFFVILIGSSYGFTKETFSPIKSDYNIQYTPDGVRDIIHISDTQNPSARLTYIDDITNIKRIQTNPQPICLPYQKQTYIDGSAVCVSKCYDIQYYDIASNQCINCPIGQKGDGNNGCIAVDPDPHSCNQRGAVIADNYGNCRSCPFGKQLNFDPKTNGYDCLDICPQHKDYNQDGSCTLKCPLQNQYSDPLYGCINCPVGYLVNDNNQCQPRPPCPAGQFLDNAGIHCVSECAVYDRYDPTTDTCTPICTSSTNPIYDPVSKSCVPCGNNQVYSGSYNKCIPAPTLPPPKCDPGFTLVNGSCQSICPDWLTNDTTDPYKCVPRCDNTQYYDDKLTFSCVDCPDGYTVDKFNECTVPIPAPSPPVCSPGFTLDTQNKCQSICPPWRTNDKNDPTSCILLCTSPTQFYDLDSNYGCSNCPPGYGVDNNNECTVPLPTTSPQPTSSPIGGGANGGGAGANGMAITAMSASNLSYQGIGFDDTLPLVTTQMFTFDLQLTLSITYTAASVTINGKTISFVGGGKQTFKGVQMTPNGVTATVNYFRTTNTNTSPVLVETYSITYTATDKNAMNAFTYTCQSGDFAAGFLVIGAGAGGSTVNNYKSTGGGGGVVFGIVPIPASAVSKSIQVTIGKGGVGSLSAQGTGGTATTVTLDSQVIANGGGGMVGDGIHTGTDGESSPNLGRNVALFQKFINLYGGGGYGGAPGIDGYATITIFSFNVTKN